MKKSEDYNKIIAFDYFKEAMTVETEKARLILCGNRKNPIKIWIPKKFVEITPSESPKMLKVKMPLWLFQKTELYRFTTWSVENE